MNTPQIRQKFTRNIQFAFTFLVLQFFIIANSYAIKLTLNGQPSDQVNELNFSNNLDIVYAYSEDYRPVMANTDEPFLCIGPNLHITPIPNDLGAPQVSFMDVLNNPEKVYGIVELLSTIYDYNIPNSYSSTDRVLKINTHSSSQCVVNGFNWIDFPVVAGPLIFTDSFEEGSGIPPVPSILHDLKIMLYKDFTDDNTENDLLLINDLDVSDQSFFDYFYVIYNNGDEAIDFDIADYFYLEDPATSVLSTVWTCNKSTTSDPLTHCGKNPIYVYGDPDPQSDTDGNSNPPNYSGSVYLRNAHIEKDDSIIIKVTRQSDISIDTPINLFVSTLATNVIDSQQLNNSDVRSFNGITNSLPMFVIPTTTTEVSELSETIIEDSSSNLIALEVLDADALDVLTVTATSVNTDIVLDNITAIDTGNGTWNIDIIPVPNANTVISGAIDIQLHVSDTKNTTIIPLHLTITPVNDPPTFDLNNFSFDSGTTGPQPLVQMFVQNLLLGPTQDEQKPIADVLSQSINIKLNGDPNGVLLFPPQLSTDLSMILSGNSGTAIVEVTIQDNGGGGVSKDTTIKEFTITVANTLPEISLDVSSVTMIEEDNTTATIAFDISDVETTDHSLLKVSLTSNNTNIVKNYDPLSPNPNNGIEFSGSGANRFVKITPVLNQHTDLDGDGAHVPVEITLSVEDEAGGISTAIFDLTINPINDMPSFTLNSNITWANSTIGSGLKQHPNYAVISELGPTPDESLQSVSQFNISTTGDDIFLMLGMPSIDSNGGLAYFLNGTGGTATVEVSLTDSGSNVGSNVNTSATQTFTITVNSAPIADSVIITGIASVGNTLTGGYNYSDIDNDLQGMSTFRWLRNGMPITNAASLTYDLVATDSGANISFEVTPIALTGEITGIAVTSNDLTINNTVPTVSGSPGSITVVENIESNVDLSAVSFTDLDGDNLTVSLTLNTGVFSIPVDGSSIGSGVNEIKVSDTVITLQGSTDDINTYLDTASNINYTGGASTLTLSASDGMGSLVSNPVIQLIL